MFVTSMSGFSLVQATSIRPVGVGEVLSALICAGFCVSEEERDRSERCDDDGDDDDDDDDDDNAEEGKE